MSNGTAYEIGSNTLGWPQRVCFTQDEDIDDLRTRIEDNPNR